MDKTYNVLFLCTGNSARSMMAECILDRLGKGRFKAYSAGSHPAGRVNPHVRDVLIQKDYPTDQLRSKSWDEFAGADAPVMDFIFTVCDQAAGEVCPIWPGHPATAAWPFPDPAKVQGTDDEIRAFAAEAYDQIAERISAFCNLPLETMDTDAVKTELVQLGDTPTVPG